MSEFRIEFSPPLPKLRRSHPEMSFEGLDFGMALQVFSEEINIIYHVNDMKFAYYPASILTALNDIQLECELIASRSSHNMTLSGYTVLQVSFESGKAIFYDPIEHSLEGSKGVAIGNCGSSDLEAIFRDALDTLWESLQSRLNAS